MTRDTQIARAEALANRIAAETKAEADRILAAARTEADTRLSAARLSARLRVSHEVVRLRREQLDAARREAARLDTQRRLLQQRAATATIDAGLPALADALDALWAEPGPRAGWIAALVNRAAAQFGPGKWCIEHAGDLTRDEIERLSTAVEEKSGQRPDLHEDPGLGAGLRLAAGSAVLDGSRAALIGNRKDTGAALLAALDEVRRTENRGNGHE